MKFIATTIALLFVPCLQAQQASESRRAVATQDITDIPQFTIEVDAFETLTEAVEYGYELPFDENTLGLAKFRQGTAVRYILALGTFYTFGEADGVLLDTCLPAELLNCRVRYLGDLESIDAETQQNASRATIDEPINQAPEPIVEAQSLEEILDVEAASEVAVQTRKVIAARTSDEINRAYDGELVYTVQVAAMYELADAQRVAKKIQANRGIAEIYPYIGGRGNLVHSVTVGRFAYKDKAQVFANSICNEIGVSGCWVKPLSMIEAELAKLPNNTSQLARPVVETKPRVLAATKEPVPTPKQVGDKRVYTVQVAAMYDENDAQSVANRIPAQFGATEVVPIRSVSGDVVYSVTVGRFAYKNDGQAVADSVCDRLNLSGCWVKPFALIEKARVEEW